MSKVLEPVSKTVPRDLKAWERCKQCVGRRIEVVPLSGQVRVGVLDSLRFESDMRVLVLENADGVWFFNFNNIVSWKVLKDE